MIGLSALAGHLDVSVRQQDGRIVKLETRLQRPLEAVSRLLVGQTPEEALQRVPLLFSLCANAQQVAALRALEQALQVSPRPEVEAARVRLCELELIRESLLRLVADWQLPLDAGLLKEVVSLCRQGSALLAPVAALKAANFAPDARLLRLLEHLRVLLASALALEDDWLNARLAPWQALQLNPLQPPLLAQHDLPLLLEALREGYACPLIDGQPRTTGPASAADPRANAAAQIAQRVNALLRRLAEAVERLEDPVCRDPLLLQVRPGEGLGCAETARGWLLHRVQLVEGRVREWQILAPTDWNFHPAGLLAAQLSGVVLPAGQGEALLRDLVLSVDPCVAFEISGLDHA